MYPMKTYKVAVVRERLAEALDEADRGMPVIIERRGVRYRVSVEEPSRARPAGKKAKIRTLDPAVDDGQWTWETDAAGLQFQGGSRR